MEIKAVRFRKDGFATQGIPPGTAFEDLPDEWRCPRCKNPKMVFNRV